MSFILDALKKSENDRQRQSGPALFEVRVAPPRSRFPVWAIAVVALLAINLAVVAWLMLRRPAAAAVPRQQAVAPAPAQDTPAPMAQFPTSQSAIPAPTGEAVGSEMPAPLEGSTAQGTGPSDAGAARSDPLLAEGRSSTIEINPDDYEPARDPSSLAPEARGSVVRSTSSGLPDYEEAATKVTLPPLRMDLHVYAPDPRKRFVLVNMKRLYEGDSLPEGVKVDSITTDGAIMSYSGTRFVLERD